MDGEYIAARMEIEEGQGAWILDNCAVREVENDGDCHAYEVFMETDNGSISRQTVFPADVQACDECRAALDRGESPVGAWEDGLGRAVCADNGEIVDGGYSIETFNGRAGDTEFYDTAEEAVREAESQWSHLSSWNRKEYMETQGAVFMVLDPHGIEIRDFIAEAQESE